MKTHPSRTFKYSVQSCCFPALLHASCSLKQQSYLHKPHPCLKRIDTWMENLWMRSFAGVIWPRPNTLPNKSNFAFTSCTHFLFVKLLLSKGFLEGQSNPGAVGYLHRSLWVFTLTGVTGTGCHWGDLCTQHEGAGSFLLVIQTQHFLCS